MLQVICYLIVDNKCKMEVSYSAGTVTNVTVERVTSAATTQKPEGMYCAVRFYTA